MDNKPTEGESPTTNSKSTAPATQAKQLTNEEIARAMRAANNTGEIYSAVSGNLPKTPEQIKALVSELLTDAEKTFMVVGMILVVVEERDLLLRFGCRTVADFAKKVLGIADTTTRRYYLAAKTAILVKDHYPDLNQSQALALASIKASSDEELRDKALKVLAEANADEGPLTAAKVEKQIEKMKPKGEQDPHRAFLLGTLSAKEKVEKYAEDTEELNADQKAALTDFSASAQRVLEALTA